MLVAVLGLAVILGYNYWHSAQHVSARPVAVDQRLPLFPLATMDGDVVDSSVLTHQPHVIMFIRGNWCPFCMAQVSQIADQYRELDSRGVRVAIISPQKSEDTVVPTVIITDRTGMVLWAEQTDNHHVRPEPTTFLDVLAQHGIRSV